MNQQCIICYHQFDRYITIPYIICPQQHIICLYCLQICRSQYERPKCNLCRRILQQKYIMQDHSLQKCDHYLTLKQELYQRQMVKFTNECVDAISDLLSFQPRNHSQTLANCLRNFIQKDVETYSYQLAKKLLQQIIMLYPLQAQKQQFFGLGSIVQLKFYGKTPFSGYWNKFYPSRSLFDELAICCQYKEDKVWYQQMIAKYPKMYQLHFGLAVLEHNFGRCEQAKKFYEQVIKINEYCSKAYQMLAFIHLPSKQSYQYALKSFKILGKFNVFIEYFFAVCGQQNKIQQLKKLTEDYPDYLQPIYNISRMQSIQGQYEEAFDNYMDYLELSKNTNRLNDFFLFVRMYFSYSHDRSIYQDIIPLMLQLLNNPYCIDHKTQIIKWIGRCFIEIKQLSIAAQWLKRYVGKEVSQQSYLEMLINAYYYNGNYQKIISLFQEEQNSFNFTKYSQSLQNKILQSYVENSQYNQAFGLTKRYKMEDKNQIIIDRLNFILKDKWTKRSKQNNQKNKRIQLQ